MVVNVLWLSYTTVTVLCVLQAIGGLPWMAFPAWVTFYLSTSERRENHLKGFKDLHPNAQAGIRL